jgi:hypothetical protein
MARHEYRLTQRFKLHIPLSFHRMETLSEGEHQAKAIDISTRGVYFATSVILCVGEALEVLLEMPKRVTGMKSGPRRFAGRVTHIESKNMPEGLSGIGVQLLYYERDLVKVAQPYETLCNCPGCGKQASASDYLEEARSRSPELSVLVACAHCGLTFQKARE